MGLLAGLTLQMLSWAWVGVVWGSIRWGCKVLMATSCKPLLALYTCEQVHVLESECLTCYAMHIYAAVSKVFTTEACNAGW